MITCKEDLMNTYIVNDFGSLRACYLMECEKFGLKWTSGKNIYESTIGMHSSHIGVSGGDVCNTIRGRKLEIEDLKPKPSPTKFVKVEESIFDLKEEFERGELYFSEWGEEKTFAKIEKEHRLMNNLNSGNVYRQVEIDWRDELDSYLDSISSLDSNFDEKVTLEFSKSKFAYNMSDNEFVAACHLVASLTEKPEGVVAIAPGDYGVSAMKGIDLRIDGAYPC